MAPLRRSRIVTLKYAQPGACICSPTASEFVNSICPQHGSRPYEGTPRKKSRSGARPKRPRQPREPGQPRQSRNGNPKRPRDPARPRKQRRPTSRASPRITGDASPLFFGEAAFKNMIGSYLRAPAVDLYQPSSPVQRPPPLTSINFLEANVEVRRLVLRHLLVPSSGRVVFPDPASAVLVTDANPGLQTAIIYANHQVYREAVRVLYGENKFVAAKPEDLFLPTGLGGLRRKTTGLIRHVAFERRGHAADLCQETSGNVLAPIWKMICAYPGLLGGLRKISIRREVLRPVDFDFMDFQRYFLHHPNPVDTTLLYKKKNMVMNVAAGLAYHAATRAAGFSGMFIVEDSEREVVTPTQFCLNNAFEVCLTKADDVRGTPPDLAETVLGVLFDQTEMEQGNVGASRAAAVAYMWWRVNQCNGRL